MTTQTQASLDGEIDALLVSGSDITAAQLRQVLHDMNGGIFQSQILGLAAPVNAVALVSSPGSSFTALRSDATLALNQGIAPVWSGQHAFANATASANTVTGAVTVAGGVGIAGMLNIGQTINSLGSIYINSAPLEAAQRATGTVSGTVSTTDLSFSLPAGATILGVTAYTSVAYGASGSVNLTAGSAVGGTDYITAQNIKSLGVAVLTLNGSNLTGLISLPSVTPNFFVRLTQTGTPSGVGSALLAVRYLVP